MNQMGRNVTNRPPTRHGESTGVGRVIVETLNAPGCRVSVDAAKYYAMRTALLEALPAASPGLTQTELLAAVLPHLPAALFQGSAKSGWWARTVRLDLEAKGLVTRRTMGAGPFRLRRAR